MVEGGANLVELTHDEHRHPHEVEDAVEKHPQHPRRAGGDLGQVEPEAVLGVTSGAVDPPVWREEGQKGARKESEKPQGEPPEKEFRSLLTADAAVHHPADHAEQEEQVTHEVAMVAASCEREKKYKKLRCINSTLVWLIGMCRNMLEINNKGSVLKGNVPLIVTNYFRVNKSQF